MNYNERVVKAINSLSLSSENRVLKEKGRNDHEIGFVLILNGIYQGFGYLNKNIEIKDIEEYQLYIQPKKDNRDIQRILRSYLNKHHKKSDHSSIG